MPAVCSGGKSRFKLQRQGKGFEKRALKLEARAAKAKAAGHTKRAAYLAKLATTYEKNGSRAAQAPLQDGKPQIGVHGQGVQAAAPTDQRPLPFCPCPSAAVLVVQPGRSSTRARARSARPEAKSDEGPDWAAATAISA